MNKRDVNEQKLFNFFEGKKLGTTDDSWENISNQLDKLERKKRKVLFIWFLLAGIMLCGTAYIFKIIQSKSSFNTMSTNNHTASNNTESINPLKPEIDREMTALNTQSAADKKGVDINKAIKMNPEISSEINAVLRNVSINKKRLEEKGPVTNALISDSSASESKTVIKDELTSMYSSTISNSQNFEIKSSPQEINNFTISNENIVLIESNEELTPIVLNNSSRANEKNITSLETLAKIEMNLLSLEDLRLTNQQLSYNSGHISHVKRIKYFVELSTGIGLPFRKIKNLNLESSDFNNIISTETPWYTFNGGLSTGLVLDEDWSILTGINYTQIMSKFEYIDATATQLEVIYDPATLEPKRYELINGEYIERGNNRIVVINIPLNFSYTKSFGAWKIGVEAGAGINYLADHSGKMLYRDQDVRRLKGGPELYKKSLGANWNAALFVQRHLSKSIALTIRPQFKRYVSDWTLQKNINLSYDIVDINIGIRKYFNN